MKIVYPFGGEIPYPNLDSWMFKRIPLPNYLDFDTNGKNHHKMMRYNRLNDISRAIFKFTNVKKNTWVKVKLALTGVYSYFRILNRLSVKGLKNIPKSGAIFYANHPGSLDPIILLSILKKPIGCFIGFDNYYLTFFAQKYLHFINRDFITGGKSSKGSSKYSKRDLLIESMIRNLMTLNRYFAIWPEGTLSKKGLVMQGFSSVIRAYSVINAEKDLIPFVGIDFKGSECYNIYNNPGLKPKTNKISVEFMKPVFIPREWLTSPTENPEGKTPREIIDFLMDKLAKNHGQKTFVPNYRLEQRKKHFK